MTTHEYAQSALAPLDADPVYAEVVAERAHFLHPADPVPVILAAPRLVCILDPELDPAVHDGGDDDRDCDDDRPFLGFAPSRAPARTAAPVVAEQPEPAYEVLTEPVANSSACASDLGLPVVGLTAVSADDVHDEDLGFTDLRDRPLTYEWHTNEKVLAAAGIGPTGDDEYNRLRNSVLTELARAADIEPRVWVSISRNENKYSAMKGKAPYWVAYTRMMSVLAELHGLGLVDEEKATETYHFIEWETPQGKTIVGRQSRYRATPRLVAAFRSVHAFHHDSGDRVLRMKDADGKAVDDFVETPYVTRLATPARAFNKMMRRHSVELVTSDALCNRTRIVIETERPDGEKAIQILCPTPTIELFRSFNRGQWTKGGRFYGWFQGLPKAFRKQLRIDGAAVVEVDFRALHPSMVYAKRGLPIPADCYAVPGVENPKHAKAAMVVMIASRSRREAIEALLKKKHDAKRPWPHDYAESKRILLAIEAYHAPIKADLYQDKGPDLMNLDSRMTAYVLTWAAKRDLPILPVHDSYICREADESLVRELMQAAWAKVMKGPCPRVEGGNLAEPFDRESKAFSMGSPEYPLQALSPLSPSLASPAPLALDNLICVQDNLDRMRECKASKVAEEPLRDVVETFNVGEGRRSQVSYRKACQDSLRAVRPLSMIASLKVVQGGVDRVDPDEWIALPVGRRRQPGVAASLRAAGTSRKAFTDKIQPGRRPVPKKASGAASQGRHAKVQQAAVPVPVRFVAQSASVPLFGDLPALQHPEVLVKASRRSPGPKAIPTAQQVSEIPIVTRRPVPASEILQASRRLRAHREVRLAAERAERQARIDAARLLDPLFRETA